MARRKEELRRGDRTGTLIWAVAITCAGFAVAVILTGVTIFTIYLAYQPKTPYIWLAKAQLDLLDYGEMGLLTTQISLTLVAENRNARAHATISDLALELTFQGIDVAGLRADDVKVEKNGSAAIRYVVRSDAVALDEAGREALDASLKTTGVVGFRLEGRARASWMVGVFVSVKVWTHLDCDLGFGVANGSSVGLRYCRSKTR